MLYKTVEIECNSSLNLDILMYALNFKSMINHCIRWKVILNEVDITFKFWAERDHYNDGYF